MCFLLYNQPEYLKNSAVVTVFKRIISMNHEWSVMFAEQRKPSQSNVGKLQIFHIFKTRQWRDEVNYIIKQKMHNHHWLVFEARPCRTLTVRPTGSLTTLRSQDEILGPTVGPAFWCRGSSVLKALTLLTTTFLQDPRSSASVISYMWSSLEESPRRCNCL